MEPEREVTCACPAQRIPHEPMKGVCPEAPTKP